MVRFAALLLCLLSLFGAGAAARADREVVAEPDLVAAGEPVTLHWFFTGDKVTVTGGRFSVVGTVVTGKTSLTDNPKKTTRYTFTSNYKAADAAGVMRPVKATYSVVVEIAPPLPLMLPYKNPRGWKITYQKGWKPEPYYHPEKGLNLCYFQPEPDSLERVTVAIVTDKVADSNALMDKIAQDMPTNYDDFKTVSQYPITFHNQPAVMAVFAGRDRTHDEAPTASLVMAFVRGDRCYVVSARTKANLFRKRRPALEKMLRSFNVG